MTNKTIYPKSIIKELETILKGENPNDFYVKLNDADEVCLIQLDINNFNPHAPYAHTSTIGRAIHELRNSGLIYSNDEFCFYLSLREENGVKYFSSAVGGYRYSYGACMEIINHFKGVYQTKPKLVNLKAGDFFGKYKVKNGKRVLKSIYRVGVVCHSSYTCFNILTQTETDHTFPSGFEKEEIHLGADCEYSVLSREEVNSYIVNIERAEMIESLKGVKMVVSGVKREDMEEYWNTIERVSLISSYSRHCSDEVKIYRVVDKGAVIYEPIGNFKFWGHKFAVLD